MIRINMNIVTKTMTIITALVMAVLAITQSSLIADNFAAFAWNYHHHDHHLWKEIFYDDVHGFHLQHHNHHHYHHDWYDDDWDD